MRVALAAQQWGLAISGGPEIRKAIPGRISFNAEFSDISLVVSKDTKKLKELCFPAMKPGEAIMKLPGSKFGMQRVRFPYTDYKACEAIARIMKSVYPEYSGSIMPKNAESNVYSAFAPQPPCIIAY